MNLRGYLKSTFGKDLFSKLKSNEILEERIRAEKRVERISDDIKGIQEKIQRLIIEAKGQPKPLKLLNIQKIKALRLESTAKAQEANAYLKQLQLLLLVEAMREHHKLKETTVFIDKILNTDIDQLSETLFTEDVQKAVEEGRIDDVKDKLKRVFAKEEIPVDAETQELLGAISDMEKVDEETALKMAEEKAKEVAELPYKKKVVEVE